MTQGTNIPNNTTTTTGLSNTKSVNNKKSPINKSANELEIGFLGINYDSNFGLDTEEEDIKKSGFKFSRSVLTIANFEKILLESPPIVHISTHGTHQDQKINNRNEFQIALEEKQTLRYLLDEHPKYSAYFAAIAIFFEMEINHFVQYGIKHKNNTNPNNRGLKLCIALLHDTKINKIYQAILQCILDRFGCYYRANPIIGCIEIFWGKYESKRFVPPHSPINQYQFAELYQSDRHVQHIYAEINAEYKHIDGEYNNNIYKFNWKILAKLLSKALHCINEERRTQIKFGDIQELTRELKIVPININRSDYGPGEKLKKLIQKVSKFKNELVTTLKQSTVIPIILDFSSGAAKNVHIIRFANKYSLREATKEINKIKAKIDVHHHYDIQFRTISNADCDTQKQVGFMGKMQEKLYSVDIKRKTDPISKLIKKHLKSKKECKIKLVILNGCHSYILGKIFSKYVENVICIHPFVKIWANTATTFTRHFYQALRRLILDRSIPFSHAVLKSFNIAKTNVVKHCSNDLQCVSHSHSHPFCNTLHLNEDWKELQNHINDTGKYDQYRNKMNQFGVLRKEAMHNLYDNKSLKISNLSMQKMQQLCEYLEREYELYDIDGKHNDKFVKDAVYRQNEYYKDLGVAFIKLGSESDRDVAINSLSELQYKESVMLSQQLLLNKVGMHNMNNLGWNCSSVHRCCCSPHHPHTVQDKFILLQNDEIINRQIIDNVSLSQMLTVDSKYYKEKEIQQSEFPAEKRQTFQNDAYFGSFKHKPKKNNFDGNNDV